MKSKYINQCSCCEKRFIQLELDQRLPMHLEAIFVELLGNDVKDLFLNGQYHLTFEDGEIAGFYYEFRGAEEELCAEDLYWSVHSISNYLYDSCISNNRKEAEVENAI